MCTPCEGLVSPGWYCWVLIGIREISVESLGSINLSEYTENKHGDLKELQDRLLAA